MFPSNPVNRQVYKNYIYDSSIGWKKPEYVEGLWSPVLSGSTGTCTMINITKGWYIKQGNLVTVGGTLAWTSSTIGGMISISGIPYVSKSSANGGDRSVGSYGAVANGITFTAGMTHLLLVCDPGQNFLYVIQSSGNSYNHEPIISSTGTIYGFQITYQI